MAETAAIARAAAIVACPGCGSGGQQHQRWRQSMLAAPGDAAARGRLAHESQIIASHFLPWEGVGAIDKINKLPLMNIIKSVILFGSFPYDTKVTGATNEMAI